MSQKSNMTTYYVSTISRHYFFRFPVKLKKVHKWSRMCIFEEPESVTFIFCAFKHFLNSYPFFFIFYFTVDLNTWTQQSTKSTDDSGFPFGTFLTFPFVFRSSGSLCHPNLEEEAENGIIKACNQRSGIKETLF